MSDVVTNLPTWVGLLDIQILTTSQIAATCRSLVPTRIGTRWVVDACFSPHSSSVCAKKLESKSPSRIGNVIWHPIPDVPFLLPFSLRSCCSRPHIRAGCHAKCWSNWTRAPAGYALSFIFFVCFVSQNTHHQKSC